MRYRLGVVPAVVIAIAMTAPPLASAALESGTPVTVAPGVPDQGRAWELITSPDPVTAMTYQAFGISADGNRLAFNTFWPLPGAPLGLPLAPPAISSRGASGWVSTSDSPPPGNSEEPHPSMIAPDFESSLWVNRVAQGPEEWALFRRAPNGSYTELISRINGLGVNWFAASADLQHVTTRSEKHLLPGDASRTSGGSLYEVVGSTLRLVDVDNGGALLSNCGTTQSVVRTPNQISRDGQRIFFTTVPGCTGPKRVYLRANGATTTAISASQCTLADCGPVADVTFAGATPNGSSAFLLTTQRLTNDDSDSSADLYRYDVAAGDLTLFSTSWAGNDLIATEAAVIPTDGSPVYFIAAEQTGPAETSGERLYMADASGLHLVSSGVPGKFVQASPDGRYALFSTSAGLAAGDTDGRVDAYRFDAKTGSTAWITAGSAGGNGAFDASIETFFAEEVVAIYPGMDDNYPYRAMSDDGSRIFFTTPERLLPEDRNDLGDVYEWANGSLGLVSAGAEGAEFESHYVISTPDGETVVIFTGDTLIPRDRDGGDLDYYAARIGGGFVESSTSPSCVESCRTAAPGGADRPLPPSAKPAGGGIRLGRIDAAARRGILATGWITLLAEVPKAGKLSATATARIGRRMRGVAAASVKVAEPGPARLRMRLSREARRRLAHGHALRVRVLVRLSRLDSARRVSFELGGKS